MLYVFLTLFSIKHLVLKVLLCIYVSILYTHTHTSLVTLQNQTLSYPPFRGALFFAVDLSHANEKKWGLLRYTTCSPRKAHGEILSCLNTEKMVKLRKFEKQKVESFWLLGEKGMPWWCSKTLSVRTVLSLVVPTWLTNKSHLKGMLPDWGSPCQVCHLYTLRADMSATPLPQPQGVFFTLQCLKSHNSDSCAKYHYHLSALPPTFSERDEVWLEQQFSNFLPWLCPSSITLVLVTAMWEPVAAWSVEHLGWIKSNPVARASWHISSHITVMKQKGLGREEVKSSPVSLGQQNQKIRKKPTGIFLLDFTREQPLPS